MIYLSGPMTGFPENNYPKFNEVAAILRDLGLEVYNPAEFEFEGDFPARRAFAEYASKICLECSTIMLLPGWENSPGANAELGLAKVCGLDVKYWMDPLDAPT